MNSFLRPRLALISILALGFPLSRAFAAEVFQVTAATKSALPGGKEADGMIGDWLMRNDLVVAVIGQTSDWRDANQMVEGVQGAVIDFTTRADNNDELVVFYPMGYRPTGVSAGKAAVVRAQGKSAELTVTREPTKEEPYTSTTTYTLNDGEPFLRIKTVHENGSSSPVNVSIPDWLRLDNDITTTSPAGDQNVITMENKWYRAAYGLAAIDGRTQRARKELDQKTLRSIGALVHYPAVDPEQKATLSLAPGAKIELNRLLVVARDIAGVQSIADAALGKKISSVHLTAAEADRKPVAEAFIDVKQGETVVTSAISSETGDIALPLADGSYTLTATQIGRPNVKRDLIVQQGQVSGDATVLFEARSEVRLDIKESGTGERLPVKVEFRASGGGINPFLGPQKRANGAGNAFYSARGQDTFAVPPGTYRVHISHGPLYGVVIKDVTVPPRGRASINAELKREFSTPHWIIADLHNHSTGSGDSGAEVSGRVLNVAAAGIQFAPATEHNRISTYTPTIKALGLEKYLASAAGIELSGRPGPGNTNHQIGFPLEIHDDQQGYGAPRTDLDPGVQMRRLYELDGRSPKLMQHNHPDIGWLYFDRDRDGVLDGGYNTRSITDVMEIRETMLYVLADTAPDSQKRTSRAFHWLQMLNQGDRIFGTANTDAHPVGPQNGSMFNYIRVEKDAIPTLDAWDVARATKQGHVVMSNGPFIEATIKNALPGDTVALPGGEGTLKVRVQQASWARIDRVQILVNGRQLPEGNFTRARDAAAFGDGVVQFEREIPLHLKTDAHIIVVATGENETIGKLIGGQLAKNNPTAMTNPIFVDVDGQGFKANGDTLDAPLPNGKPRPDERDPESP